ncbi:hypothetical protein L7F22_038468 [Adiantum nelumboides]|nr:hypothetical protein [Adiantum nelumboides]
MSLFLLGMAVCCTIRARINKRSKRANTMAEAELQSVLPLLPSRFTYKEIAEATQSFSNLLGEGGCGSVYGGTLPSGRKVAVKRLELSLQGQTKQFLAEVATIGSTSHQNIVHLVGFCWDASHRLLVYEYVERGSLDRLAFHRWC